MCDEQRRGLLRLLIRLPDLFFRCGFDIDVRALEESSLMMSLESTELEAEIISS